MTRECDTLHKSGDKFICNRNGKQYQFSKNRLDRVSGERLVLRTTAGEHTCRSTIISRDDKLLCDGNTFPLDTVTDIVHATDQSEQATLTDF